MLQVVYMNPRGGGPGRQNGSNNSSTKSHQSSNYSDDTSSGVPEHLLIQKENQANERARQISLHGFPLTDKPCADEIDLDMDSTSCSYVQFNPGGNNGSHASNPHCVPPIPRHVPPHQQYPPFSSHSLHYKDDPTTHDYSYPSFEGSSSCGGDSSSPRSPTSHKHMQLQQHSRSPSFPSSAYPTPTPPPKRPGSIEGLKPQYRPRFPSPQQQHPQLPTKGKSSKRSGSDCDAASTSRSGSRGGRSDKLQQNRSLLHHGSGSAGGGGSNQRAQCKYCDETYALGENPRGSCKDAPDASLKCINYVTCLFCARCMLYHCVSKEENWDDPYDCDNVEEDELQCPKWSLLSCLTLFVPCLWCYFVLRGCHRCGTACGCCGARHKSTS